MSLRGSMNTEVNHSRIPQLNHYNMKYSHKIYNKYFGSLPPFVTDMVQTRNSNKQTIKKRMKKNRENENAPSRARN